ncbi:MAG: ThuA domain-containing protein [Thermoguttaceae bacterium]|nr:ThuA domain-containing protein [Thermoguttaceae bacterium]
MITKKRPIVPIFLLSALVLVCTALRGGEPIRLLFVDRGHPYDEPAFLAMLDSFGDSLAISRAHLPEDQSMIAPSAKDSFDVVLFYDQDQTPISDEAMADYRALFDTGIGIFVLHHHLSAHPERPDFWELAGGCYVFESNRNIGGQTLPLGDYHHDETVRVHVEKKHPIVEGIDDFTIVDEVYENAYVSPEAETLLTTDHPKSIKQIGWLWNKHRSPVFTLELGHDAQAYDNPNFRRIFIQAIRWLKERSDEIQGKN